MSQKADKSARRPAGAVRRACFALELYGGIRSTYVDPSDEELHIAACAYAEVLEQREDIYSLVVRTLVRHGWVENGAALDAQAANAFHALPSPEVDASPIALHQVSVDQQLSSLKSQEEQFSWSLTQIRGSFASIDAFHKHCYDLDELAFLSAAEKQLMRTWRLLRSLPPSLIDTVTAAELMELQNGRDAIELHALGICVGSEALRAQEAMYRDRHRGRYGGERHSRRLAQ